MPVSLTKELARELDISPDEAQALAERIATYVKSAADDGLDIPDLGSFGQDEQGRLAFTPASSLKRVVNHRFAGLTPVSVSNKEADASAAAPPPEDEPDETNPSLRQSPPQRRRQQRRRQQRRRQQRRRQQRRSGSPPQRTTTIRWAPSRRPPLRNLSTRSSMTSPPTSQRLSPTRLTTMRRHP